MYDELFFGIACTSDYIEKTPVILLQIQYFSPDDTLIQGPYKRNRHFQRYVVSPDLTPCDFFVPPLPVSLNELKQSITSAVASVDEDMLRSVWTELDYPIDICRVTKGSHIEHFVT